MLSILLAGGEEEERVDGRVPHAARPHPHAETGPGDAADAQDEGPQTNPRRQALCRREEEPTGGGGGERRGGAGDGGGGGAIEGTARWGKRRGRGRGI